MNEYDNEQQLIRRWFDSDQWSMVLQHADKGCEDSVELMEEVNDHLGSLIFHLQNESGPSRVQYELKYFDNLCDDFGVA